MKTLILTLVLGVAAAAPAQTSGDARCATSTVGKYWMAVTQDSGYCAPSPAERAQQLEAIKSAQTTTNGSNDVSAAWGGFLEAAAQTYSSPQCPNGKFWVATQYGGYCASSLSEQAPTQQGDAQCLNSTYGKFWVATTYGGYCASSPSDQVLQQQEATQAQLAAQQKLQQQQAEYQRQLLQQQAEYQRQLLQQQAELARRQMALQYLMNMNKPSYTPAPPVYNPSVVAPFYNNLNNNNIHCTTQTPSYVGGTAYTNCY
jgi:hypothetical protein